MNEQFSQLDDPLNWVTHPLTGEGPLPAGEIASVQAEIDSILGLTRGRPKAILVWAGDRRYWRQYHAAWNAFGHPTGPPSERPHVLWKTIVGDDGELQDVFPHRWILLTRLEPEQYVPLWHRDSRRWSDHHGCYVQVLPETPPAEYWLWYTTIAEHAGFCCGQAARLGERCFGRYAHPRLVLGELRQAMDGLRARGVVQCDPFASPDRLMVQARQRMSADYERQALRRFERQKRAIIEAAPLAFADIGDLERHAPLSTIRRKVRDSAERAIEAEYERFEKQVK